MLKINHNLSILLLLKKKIYEKIIIVFEIIK